MNYFRCSLLLSLLFVFSASGQEIDYRYHLNYMQKQEVFVNYENDLFLSTDAYYTQGTGLAYKRPVSDESRSVNKLFAGKGNHTIGFGFDQLVFTPTTISTDSVLRNDRPFAATVRLNTLFETVDSAKNRAFSWTISAGIIGKQALGRETQTAIHRATKNEVPKGWQNQINTGLLLDLNVYAQQQLLAFGTWFILVAEETGWVGTSRINATLGTRLQLQYLSKNRKYAFGGYVNPAVTAIAYEGTLQGSLIGKESIYAVSAGQVRNIIFERECGAFFRLHNFEMNSVVNIFTNNFLGGNLQRWGGIKLKVYF